MRQNTAVRTRPVVGREHKKHSAATVVGGLFLMAVLLAAAAAAVYYANGFRQRLGELEAEQAAVVETARAELAQAKEELASLDLSDPNNTEMQETVKKEALEAAQKEADELSGEIDALDAQLREAEGRLTAAESGEEYAYYKQVYDAYAEGKEYVEELLSDH